MPAPMLPHSPPATRERLVAAMSDALQRRGMHGIGLTELLQAAQAPKGVLYHHFPGGKTELAVAAIEAAVTALGTRLDALRQRTPDPLAALRAWLDGAQRQLQRSGFEAGCPLAAVALESAAGDTTLRAALAKAFATLRGRLASLLRAAGLPAPRAAAFATLLLSAYEGALMQARVAGNTQALTATLGTLLDLLARELEGPTRAGAATRAPAAGRRR